VRVLELSQRFPPAVGGVEATLLELVEGLRAAGVDLEVYTTDLLRHRPFLRGRDLAEPPGVPVRRFRAIGLPSLPLGLGVLAPGMLPATFRSGADVLHAHAFGYFPTWVGAVARRWRSTPLVVTTHADPGRGTTFSRPYHRLVALGTLRWADRIVVQSRVESEFLTGLGVAAERLVTIPTGIRVSEFAPGPAARGSATVRFLTVGRLDLEQKGLRSLVEALGRLPAGLAWEADILGDDWGGLAPLRALANARGIAARLRVRPWAPRAEVRAAFRRADVFVLPSRFESFPRVLIEAMASGLPVVATRVGGVPEMCADGGNARLVPPDDPGALAAALEELATDPALRERFAVESRRRAERYDWSALIPRYVALFEELAGAPRARG
jgi:glycosyltransferase involved in cell wall biosynthesis